MGNRKIRELRIGKRYSHFKNNFYRVVGLYDSSSIDLNFDLADYREYAVNVVNALNEEPVRIYVSKWELSEKIPYQMLIFDKNDKLLEGTHVFYMALYDCPCGTHFIREYNNFMSLRDKEKYPNYAQEYRFEYADV